MYYEVKLFNKIAEEKLNNFPAMIKESELDNDICFIANRIHSNLGKIHRHHPKFKSFEEKEMRR